MSIVFQFSGGPLDGKSVEGSLGRQDEADRYYVLTHHGRVGQRFRIASPYAVDQLAEEQFREEEPHRFQQHVYRVVDRYEAAGDVIVQVEYVP